MRFFSKALLLCSIILTLSCSSSDDESPNVASDPEFSVDIAGDIYQAEVKEAFLFNDTLTIQASDANGENMIVLSVKNPSETTFTTASNNGNDIPDMTLKTIPSALTVMTDANDPNAGSLSISELDLTNNLVSGSFDFTGTSPFFLATTELSNGVFNDIPITNSKPDNYAGGSLSFNLDGEEFVPSSLFVNWVSLVGDDVHLIFRKPGSATFIIQFKANINEGIATNFNIQANVGTAQIGPTGPNGTASLTILENDIENNHIVGTFEAVLDDDFTAGDNPQDFVITNGEFDVTYRN